MLTVSWGRRDTRRTSRRGACLEESPPRRCCRFDCFGSGPDWRKPLVSIAIEHFCGRLILSWQQRGFAVAVVEVLNFTFLIL